LISVPRKRRQRSNSQVMPPRIVGSAISVDLATSSATYHSPDPVLINVGFRNETSSDLLVNVEAPWHTVALVVRDAAGVIVKPEDSPYLGDWHVLPQIKMIKAGETVVVKGPGVNGPAEWADITRWGYSPPPP
jgi:NADPH-dependent curcumin reductase CurA